MILFINTISLQSCIALYDSHLDFVGNTFWSAKGNESSTLIPHIESLLQAQGVSYDDLSHVVVVHGPGSFTGVRTSVLVANTLAYTLNIPVASLGYFDLFNDYPIVKASSKRDVFFQKSKGESIEIVSNDDLVSYLGSKSISKIFGEMLDFLPEGVTVFDKINYETILSDRNLIWLDRIEPLYIKRPNIS
ncbi:tRNA (adenosine(37)-N6)-threonylcarbamoyltransferase complex dimerization subunit type 1 TsaB [Candidatus Gracilibacteria bacterium]|nr:tRNA (adenosine(37)-N6)-threonylcarbamoyltransferase complex dimerization subunit type 1 TsaB [Candidatus Gracilibacteria bacterium]